MLHEARSDELIDVWTLVDADWRLVANKRGRLSNGGKTANNSSTNAG